MPPRVAFARDCGEWVTAYFKQAWVGVKKYWKTYPDAARVAFARDCREWVIAYFNRPG